MCIDRPSPLGHFCLDNLTEGRHCRSAGLEVPARA